jgi:hypothetical protein
MTDSIDLDELEVDGDDGDDESERNRGDWLWRGEGEPETESTPTWSESADGAGETPSAASDEATGVDDDSPADEPRTPKVPGAPEGPVGVPESQGGAGGGATKDEAQEQAPSTDEPNPRTTTHGGDADADEMTLAFTYEAANRLADPQIAIADARGWSDWIGIVGKVSTPAIRKFQRDERIDLDFFGGSETGPAQRLLDITPDSMFYAERMVVVGAKNDERIAEEADWEFIPLETAAEKAGWEIEFAE